MTIEYTYPEKRPTGATVTHQTGPYVLLPGSHPVYTRLGFANVHRDAVPEVCEAMMTLAGHKWPVKPPVPEVANAIDMMVKKAGERIIARLEEASFHPLQGGPLVERRAAIAIVREECGVAE